MKINMPVTNHEVMFGDDEFMLTKTDLKGVITYANQYFIKTSGFTAEELIGSSHNIVRHPDMPVEAFADLWKNLKVGRPWSGLVKNRTKQGDYYWVKADVAPILENGKVVGYFSARRKPTRQQVSEADAAYRLFKEGKAKDLVIHEGQVLNNSLLSKIKYKLLDFKLPQRLAVIVTLASILLIAQSWVALDKLNAANQQMMTIYSDRLVPIDDLGRISNMMLENRTNLRVALSEVTYKLHDGVVDINMDSKVSAQAADSIEKNITEITELWKKYMATSINSDEKLLADKFAETRGAFVKEALLPAVASLRDNDYEKAMQYSIKAKTLYDIAHPNVTALIKYQSEHARAEYDASVSDYQSTLKWAIASLILVVGLLACFAYFIMRSIANPLSVIFKVLDNIKSNRLDTEFVTSGNNELGRVLRALKVTQTMLSVNVNEAKELAHVVKEQSAQYEGQLAAISQSTGVIEFDMQANIIAVNDIYLKMLDCTRDEVLGQKHDAHLEASELDSNANQEMWQKMLRGEAVTGEFKRIGKGGKEFWIQASYNPILSANGEPYKVVQYATDITTQKIKNADFEGQVAAINRSQGVIELGLDGTILKANPVYLNMLGYNENELVGRHVSMVLDPAFAKSPAYNDLWANLMQGNSDSGQYKRIAKSGKEVWIQASYNPIYDVNGKLQKIANYTIDITEQKLQAAENAGKLSAIDKIQAVVEFDLTGKITAVNDNFSAVTGYTEKEIVGNHHRMFVEASHHNSAEYKALWERLAKGEADVGQYKRIGKGGKEIWLQATYNPIFDMNGKPFKVVKYATDITEQHQNALVLTTAVDETQSVIEKAKTGDLSNRVPLDGKTGAIASLCDGVNALMDKMTEVIIQVKEAGETINTAAGEISSGNNDLSSRTEQQASSLEETA
ncbi:MAG: diguanylate cyclase, partial [Methylotenera sp.]|uniref:PAS domain S-box protein n=1 Tax=Methylotenera sp. TaxID=2051956 RepID=UPI000D44807B